MGLVIATFDSTRAAIRAERACLAAGIGCQAIPLPRDISAECGIALEMREDERSATESVLRGEGIAATFISRRDMDAA